MKLAAMQLMQQKSSLQENVGSLENGSPATSSDSSAKTEPRESSLSEDKMGDSIDGESKVKELAETMASNNEAGRNLFYMNCAV